MNSEKVKLSHVKVNAENPRTIKDERLERLVGSILVFPKMLELRPIVVDREMRVLGGNMRTKALREIAKMKRDEIESHLSGQLGYQRMDDAKREELLSRWEQWLESPTADIAYADDMTEAECREFVIRDNIQDGEWDFGVLASSWDSNELADWGLEVPSWDDDFGDMEDGEEEKNGVGDKLQTCPKCGFQWKQK